MGIVKKLKDVSSFGVISANYGAMCLVAEMTRNKDMKLKVDNIGILIRKGLDLEKRELTDSEEYKTLITQLNKEYSEFRLTIMRLPRALLEKIKIKFGKMFKKVENVE